jgi:hypothetical protein
MAICIHCHTEKQQSDFAKRGSKYRSTCKICHNDQKKIWSKDNIEKRKKSISDYYTKKTGRPPDQRKKTCLTEAERVNRKHERYKRDYAKNKKAYLERAKSRNVEKRSEISKYNFFWRKLNKDHKKQQDASWRSSNLPKVNAYSSARRSAKINATPPWLSAIQKAQIQEMYDISLARSVQTGIRHHVDHIHPLNGDGFAGLHVPWNLRVITSAENLSKGRRLPPEDMHLGWGTA